MKDGVITYKPESKWLDRRLRDMVTKDKLFKETDINSVKLSKVYVAAKDGKEYVTISLKSGDRNYFDMTAPSINIEFTSNKINFKMSWMLCKNQQLDISLIRLVMNKIKKECRLWADHKYEISTSGKCIKCGHDKFTITFIQQKVLAKWDENKNEWVIEQPVYNPDIANGNNHDKIHCAKCGTYHQAAPGGLPGLAIVTSEKEKSKFSK